MPNYVYSNPFADAANTASGGATTLGETVLRMAMLRQQQKQRQQDVSMQMAQMQQQAGAQRQRFNLEQQGLNLQKQGQEDTQRYREGELDIRRKNEESASAEHDSVRKEYDQRLNDAVMLQRLRGQMGGLMGRIGQNAPPVTSGGMPAYGPPAPQLDEGGMSELQSLIGQTTAKPEDALNSIALLRAIQAGALNNPNTQAALVGGVAPKASVSPLGANPLAALSRIVGNPGVTPGDPTVEMASQAIRAMLAQVGITNSVPLSVPTNSSNIKAIRRVN